MRKLVWITPSYFFDTDGQIVHLLKKKYDIDWYVICAYGTPPVESAPFEQNTYVDKIITQKHKHLIDPRAFINVLRFVLKVRRTSPDLIYIGWNGMPYAMLLFFLLCNKKKMIFSGHEVDTEKWWSKNSYKRHYHRYFLKRIGYVHVFSEHMRDRFHQLFPKTKYLYIPMAAKNWGEPTKTRQDYRRTFLFFGGIRANKRLDILMDAFKGLDENYSSRARLLICGNCSEEVRARVLKATENRNNIELHLKFTPIEEVANVFNASDYIVLPYEEIAQSGVMHTSQNYYLPCIVSDIDGFKGFVEDKKTGFVFHKGDVSALRTILENCIDQSPEEYNDIKANYKKFVDDNYSREAIAQKYIANIDNIINQ